MSPARRLHSRLALVVLLFVVSAALVRAQSISVTPSSTTYSSAGGTITFTVQIQFSVELSALGLQVSAPSGWAFGELGGANRPQIAPLRGDQGALDFAYTNVPGSPTTFTFSVSHGAGLSGSQTFGGIVATLRPANSNVLRPTAPDVVLQPAAGGGSNPGGAVSPVIQSQPTGATVEEGKPFTLMVVATGTSPFSYQWRKDGAAIGGATAAAYSVANASAASAGVYSVVVSNSAGSVTSAPAVVALAAKPAGLTIAQQPVALAAAPGDTITLQVTATASTALSYQWFKDGVALPGQTGSRLVLANASQADDADYFVDVTAGSERVRSAPARVTVGARNAAPIVVRQPTTAMATPGGTAAFAVSATGNPVPSYQWRKNGMAVSGATGASLALTNVQAGDAGGYEVVVTNSLGFVTSSLAQLVVQASPSAPLITRQPASVAAVVGRSVSLEVAATGIPMPLYQWSKDGVALAGATGAILPLAAVTASAAGNYTVVVRNEAGTAESRPAVVRVLAQSYTGTYFGTLSAGGNFALHVRDDNTATFMAYVPGLRTGVVSGDVIIADGGTFRFAAAPLLGTPARAAAPASGDTGARVVAAAGEIAVDGAIAANGDVAGNMSGTASLGLTGKRVASGATSNFSGYYQAAAAGSVSQLHGIVGPSGQTLVLARVGGVVDGGMGSIDATGRVTVATTAAQAIVLNVTADGGAISGSATTAGGPTTTFSGHNETAPALAEQRLVNISARTTAGTGDAVAIVGFVIEGLEAKPVLIRAVGPALGSFGVGGTLAAPRLELVRGQKSLAVNSGWSSTAAGGSEVAAAGTRAGAFAFSANSADAAILTTLSPGVYSAVVSAADGRPGIGLVEVYDLSGASKEQRLVNISTRATAGAGDATLIAGLVIGGNAPKRVLVRAAGPALSGFGVSGALARPLLRIFSGDTVVAQNAGWSGGVEAEMIADAAARVGAFAFGAASADAAIVVNLAPGAYTAQVSSVDGATGIALLEVYEVK